MISLQTHPALRLSQPTQSVLWCRSCGSEGKLIAGYCSRCYARRHWDRRHFSGLRAQVLERDGHACQLCARPAQGKRSIVVHHRRPGVSKIPSLISLCPGCHARLHKTRVWAACSRLRPEQSLLPLLLEGTPSGGAGTTGARVRQNEIPAGFGNGTTLRTRVGPWLTSRSFRPSLETENSLSESALLVACPRRYDFEAFAPCLRESSHRLLRLGPHYV